MDKKIDLKLFTLNCNGLIGCFNEVLDELILHSDVMFLSEHWLQHYQIPAIKNLLTDRGFVSHLKSSIDPEEILYGRPYGGTGFVCRNIDGIIFQNVLVDNDRISSIKVIQSGTGQTLLNIIGVYLPFYNGSVDQTSLYSETLDKIQNLIDDCAGTPVMIMGDMNASLPNKRQLDRHWHRCRPFTSHSLMLYDFLNDNDFCVANFCFNQSVNYTYEKGNCRSYIDHVFVSKHVIDNVSECNIAFEDWTEISDHLPIRTKYTVTIGSQTNDQPSSDDCKDYPKYQRINWDIPTQRLDYMKHVNSLFNAEYDRTINALSKCIDTLQTQNCIDSAFDVIVDVIHNASKVVCGPPSVKRKHGKRVPWWSQDCTVARDRARFWRSLWVKCNRDKLCHVFSVYKYVKKTYRNVRRQALKEYHQNGFKRLFSIFNTNNPKKFWNTVRAMKSRRESSSHHIQTPTLFNYFVEKFSETPVDAKSSSILSTEEEVIGYFNNLEHSISSKQPFTGNRVRKFIKKLKPGRAAGYDGVTPEHLKHSIESKLPEILSVLLNTCVKYGILPRCFRNGVLVPILKKPNLDPSSPGNYRPIIMSSVFTKIMEYAMLEGVSDHNFHDLQFGFIEGRGTTMAICTAKDAISYVNSRGTSVYACALDAEKAFDGVPHSILLKKSLGVLPDHWWRLLYNWYSDLSAVIKWNDKISNAVPLRNGTH